MATTAAAALAKPRLQFLRLRVPIQEQLRIEEALFRVDKRRNWFIYNEEKTPVTIVMGISGKPEQLLQLDAVKRDGIPVLKRFSGGGTVIVDHNTVFTTFICNVDAFPYVKPFPREIMAWSSTFFSPFFNRVCDNGLTFALREDDYVFGDRKFGGNAQSISKDRWLHHTSFLWDFDPKNMEYLTNPARQPAYRQQRSHLQFLCTLKEVLKKEAASRDKFAGELRSELATQFVVEDVDVASLESLLSQEHRRATKFLTL
uniref:BPL/LPL catalytic domain-containing protein n=1 Tax=Globisporangium ultimum (strain ATCC 200006 / CBS 805.95 / DAOM BR144) TaxID=431595 RepID=K3X3W5_GLOUD